MLIIPPRSLFVLFLVCLSLFTSCTTHPKVVGHKDYVKYLNDPKNGLVKENTVNGIKVNIVYHPSQLLAMQDLFGNKKPTTDEIIKSEKRYAGHYYFLLKYSKEGKEVIRQLGSNSRYSDMLQVFAFEMNRFVNLTTPSHDTIMVADYVFGQTYGMSNGNAILLSFDKEKLKGQDEFDINVGECGLGIGSMKFTFKQTQLSKLPQMDYQKTE